MLLIRNTAQKNLQKFFSSCQKKTLSKQQKKAQDNDKIHEEN